MPPNEPSRTVHILLCTDRKGVPGAAVTGRSIVENATRGTHFVFHLFHGGLDEETVGRLERSWQVAGKPMSLVPVEFPVSRVRDLVRSRDIPYIAYARLFLGELLSPDVSRCVYCDIDILFERDVTELHATELEGAVLGAVPNASPEVDEADLRRLGVPGTRYFNTGMLLVDVDEWRVRDVARRALDFARGAGEGLRMHDQDALNAVLYDSWKQLPEHWNRWRSDTVNWDEPYVVHMAMSPKPWQVGYAGPHAPRFFEYLDRTEFGGVRPRELGGLAGLARRAWRVIPYWPSVLRRIGRVLRSLGPS